MSYLLGLWLVGYRQRTSANGKHHRERRDPDSTPALSAHPPLPLARIAARQRGGFDLRHQPGRRRAPGRLRGRHLLDARRHGALLNALLLPVVRGALRAARRPVAASSGAAAWPACPAGPTGSRSRAPAATGLDAGRPRRRAGDQRLGEYFDVQATVSGRLCVCTSPRVSVRWVHVP